MPNPVLSLEVGAISALANLSAADPDAALALLDETGIQAQDFEGPCRAIWAVVESMVRDGRHPDFFAVEAKCPGVSRQILHDALLSDSSTPPRERLLALRDVGQRRRLAKALEVVRGVVLDRSRPLAAAVSEAQRVLESVRQPDAHAVTLDAEVSALGDMLDEIASGRREPVLPTGIDALDAVIGGLQPTLTILGALPGVGKSGLIAAAVRNLAARGVRVGLFSLEDERSWVVRRLVAERANIPLFVLCNKPLGPKQLGRAQAAMGELHEHLRNVVADDRPALTSADVIASAREMLTRHGVRAIFVDHLGEIRLTRTDRHDLDIADALQQLRALAKTYRVPVVVACHLKRREGLGPKDEARLTDFAFSAAVERMARVGLSLSKPEEKQLRVHVLKQTNGRSGIAVTLDFNAPAGVVTNADSDRSRVAAQAIYGETE